MANDVYQYPEQTGEQPLREALSTADSFQYSPEKQPGAYELLVKMGEKTREYIDMAVAVDAADNSFLKKFGFVPRLTVEKLVQEEGVLGGELFGEKGHLFWLAPRDESLEQRYGKAIVDYYYSKLNPKNSQPEFTLHYLIAADGIQKFYQAREHPLSVGELQHLIKVIGFHQSRVRHKFSPIDELIEETGNGFEDTDSHRYKHAA